MRCSTYGALGVFGAAFPEKIGVLFHPRSPKGCQFLRTHRTLASVCSQERFFPHASADPTGEQSRAHLYALLECDAVAARGRFDLQREREIHRAGITCTSWPATVPENSAQRPGAGPKSWASPVHYALGVHGSAARRVRRRDTAIPGPAVGSAGVRTAASSAADERFRFWYADLWRAYEGAAP
jgi:hypothetical protein